MYHKMKSTLAGLSFVVAAFCGGLLLSEPVPAQPTATPISAETQEAAVALAVVKAAVRIAEAGLAAQAAALEAEAQAEEAARHAAKRLPSRTRLELNMPFYSFGAMLPRRRES